MDLGATMNKEQVKKVLTDSIIYTDGEIVVGKLRAGDLHKSKRMQQIDSCCDDWCNVFEIR
jgi:hypothetical protein